MTDLLFQAPFQIDISDVLPEGDPHAKCQGAWYTKNPVMKDFLTSNGELEYPLDT